MSIQQTDIHKTPLKMGGKGGVFFFHERDTQKGVLMLYPYLSIKSGCFCLLTVVLIFSTEMHQPAAISMNMKYSAIYIFGQNMSAWLSKQKDRYLGETFWMHRRQYHIYLAM